MSVWDGQVKGELDERLVVVYHRWGTGERTRRMEEKLNKKKVIRRENKGIGMCVGWEGSCMEDKG